MRAIATIGIGAVISSLSFAATAQSDDVVSYTHLDAGYINYDLDNDYDVDGFNFKGRFALPGNFFLHGDFNYLTGEDEFFEDESEFNFDIDYVIGDIGVGYHQQVADRVSVFAEAGFAYVDAEFDVDDELDYVGDSIEDGFDETGYSAEVGARFAFSEAFTAETSVQYMDLGDQLDQTMLHVDGTYQITEMFGIGARGDFGSEYDSYGVFARVNF